MLPLGNLTLAFRVLGEYPALVAYRYYIKETLINIFYLKNITAGLRTKLYLVVGEDLGHEVGTNLVGLQVFYVVTNSLT